MSSSINSNANPKRDGLSAFIGMSKLEEDNKEHRMRYKINSLFDFSSSEREKTIDLVNLKEVSFIKRIFYGIYYEYWFVPLKLNDGKEILLNINSIKKRCGLSTNEIEKCAKDGQARFNERVLRQMNETVLRQTRGNGFTHTHYTALFREMLQKDPEKFYFSYGKSCPSSLKSFLSEESTEASRSYDIKSYHERPLSETLYTLYRIIAEDDPSFFRKVGESAPYDVLRFAYKNINETPEKFYELFLQNRDIIQRIFSIKIDNVPTRMGEDLVSQQKNAFFRFIREKDPILFETIVFFDFDMPIIGTACSSKNFEFLELLSNHYLIRGLHHNYLDDGSSRNKLMFLAAGTKEKPADEEFFLKVMTLIKDRKATLTKNENDYLNAIFTNSDVRLNRLIHLAVYSGFSNGLKAIHEVAPTVFKETMLQENVDANTPLMEAIEHQKWGEANTLLNLYTDGSEEQKNVIHQFVQILKDNQSDFSGGSIPDKVVQDLKSCLEADVGHENAFTLSVKIDILRLFGMEIFLRDVCKHLEFDESTLTLLGKEKLLEQVLMQRDSVGMMRFHQFVLQGNNEILRWLAKNHYDLFSRLIDEKGIDNLYAIECAINAKNSEFFELLSDRDLIAELSNRRYSKTLLIRMVEGTRKLESDEKFFVKILNLIALRKTTFDRWQKENFNALLKGKDKNKHTVINSLIIREFSNGLKALQDIDPILFQECVILENDRMTPLREAILLEKWEGATSLLTLYQSEEQKHIMSEFVQFIKDNRKLLVDRYVSTISDEASIILLRQLESHLTGENALSIAQEMNILRLFGEDNFNKVCSHMDLNEAKLREFDEQKLLYKILTHENSEGMMRIHQLVLEGHNDIVKWLAQNNYPLLRQLLRTTDKNNLNLFEYAIKGKNSEFMELLSNSDLINELSRTSYCVGNILIQLIGSDSNIDSDKDIEDIFVKIMNLVSLRKPSFNSEENRILKDILNAEDGNDYGLIDCLMIRKFSRGLKVIRDIDPILFKEYMIIENDERTPLMTAIGQKNWDVVRLLLNLYTNETEDQKQIINTFVALLVDPLSLSHPATLVNYLNSLVGENALTEAQIKEIVRLFGENIYSKVFSLDAIKGKE